MERKEAIRSAYRLTGGNNFYDGMITCSTLSGKAVCRLVWDMNKEENDAYLEKALSGIQTTGIRRARRTSAPRRLRTTNVKGTKVSRETSLVMNMLPKKHSPTSTSVS